MHKARAITTFLMMFVLPNFAAAGDALSDKQIANELIDQPFIYLGYENGERKEGRIVYSRSGKLFILTRQGYLDGGTWQVSNGELCTRVTIGRQGARKCFAVYPNPDGSYSTNHNYKLFPVVDNRFIGA